MQRLHQVFSSYTIWNEIPSMNSSAAALGSFHEASLVMDEHGQAKRVRTSDGPEESPPQESPPQISTPQVQAFFVSTSSSVTSDSEDVCGPHQDCCGGSVVNGAHTPCAKRLGKGGSQHARGQVCLSLHKFFQCASCNNVAHAGCFVRNVKGSNVLSSAVPFQCYTCSSKKEQQQISVQSGAEGTSTAAAPAVQASEPTRTFASEIELRKHFRTCNWRVRGSTDSRIYYHCQLEKCNVTFKAKKCSDDTWVISKMPTSHSCGASEIPQVRTSLVTFKHHLSESVCQQIERLGASNAFTSKQIQKHMLSDQNVLVDTKLIHNIVYRVRQHLFGHKGDMIHLLEQQKVAFMCLCTQAVRSFISAHACRGVAV